MIYKYNNFLNEASLNDDKVNVDYQLSRSGRVKAFQYSDGVELESFNIKFEYTNETPNDDDNILLIRPSSFSEIKFGNFIRNNNLEINDILLYKLTSDDISHKWAIAIKGTSTTMLRQLTRTGSSKRGDYFRETAFLIRLAQISWETKKVGLKIFSNRGEVEMLYQDGKQAEMSDQNSIEFRDAYYDYMNKSSKKVIKILDEHCHKLIKYLGDNINDIKYLIKNSKDLLINNVALGFIKEEASISNLIANQNDIRYRIPEKTNLAKWNPSDIWIVFDESLLEEGSSYNSIDDIDELNEYLYNCLYKRNGLIGISLKQSVKNSSLIKINVGDTRHINRFKDFEISNNKKTSEIDFDFKKIGATNWQKGSGIDCRTFDSSTSSSISLEVKGKKGGGYVSGKAGSMINYLLPPDILKVKEIVRKNKSKSDIRKKLNIDFNRIDRDPTYRANYLPTNDRLRKVFLEDLSDDNDKNGYENSRLQSVIFLDWLTNLPEEDRDDTITDLIRFAKSESLWAAPHIVLK